MWDAITVHVAETISSLSRSRFLLVLWNVQKEILFVSAGHWSGHVSISCFLFSAISLVFGLNLSSRSFGQPCYDNWFQLKVYKFSLIYYRSNSHELLLRKVGIGPISRDALKMVRAPKLSKKMFIYFKQCSEIPRPVRLSLVILCKASDPTRVESAGCSAV